MKTIGIVILNYNDSKTVLRLIEKISGYKSIKHILVVDNCSTDGSYNKLKTIKIDRYEVISTDKNRGYAYGNNFGAKYLIDKYKEDFILIANPDVEFTEDYIIEILKTFEENQQYSLLSGIVFDDKGQKQKSYWNLPTFYEEVVECTIFFRKIRKLFDNNNINYKQSLISVDVVLGSFFVIKSSILESVGFLDEGTFLFYEENILGKRLKNCGHKVGIITGISYIHRHSTTIKKTMKILDTHKIYLQSKMYYAIKYNKINKIQRILLKIAMQYSILEIFILIQVKKLIKM